MLDAGFWIIIMVIIKVIIMVIIMVIIVGNHHLTAPMASMRKRGSREQAQATDLQSVRNPSRYAWGPRCDYQMGRYMSGLETDRAKIRMGIKTRAQDR